MTHDDKTSRSMLLNMIRGTESTAYMWAVGWLIVIADAAYFTEQPRGSEAVPCEDGALRSIYGLCPDEADSEAPTAGGCGIRYIATWRHFDDTDDEAEIAEAMAKYPCLVNYGGKLRAVNVEAGGSEVAVILKDMQA